MESVALTIAIFEAILINGPRAVVTIAAAFENKDPSPEDIKALFITKKPEEYFKDELE